MVRALVLALVAMTLAPSPAGAVDYATECAEARNYVYTFTVETEWQKRVYSPGDTVRVTVTVTRPAPEDPAGLGIPLGLPTAQPAEGVDVSTSFQGFFPYVFDRDITNADGKAKLALKLPNKTKKGRIDAYTYAGLVHNSNGPACTDFEEYGFRWDVPAITVR